MTRTQGKKFEDMFPVKMASEGTSLNTFVSKLCQIKGQACFWDTRYKPAVAALKQGIGHPTLLKGSHIINTHSMAIYVMLHL